MSIRRIALAACFMAASTVAAQENTESVNLVQTFFQDATITPRSFGEVFFQYATYEGDLSSIEVALQGAFPLSPKVQLSGGVGFRNFSANNNSEGGISDIAASLRYKVVEGPTAIAVGGLLTLPVGSEDIGEGSLDFGFFGSLRHPLPSKIVLTGSLGLQFFEKKILKYNPATFRFEEDSEYDNSLLIAGGLIYPMPSGLSFIGELNIQTEGDYILLSGGLDYALQSGGRLRGALGIGLDDGAPNFVLRGGYYLGF